MRRRSLIISLVAFALTIVVATPVSADPPFAPVGEQLTVFGEPDTYDADEPFFVIHGWFAEPSVHHPVGLFDFRLEIDGVDQGRGHLLNEGVGQDGGLTRVFLYNYFDGLPAGDHEFVGRWIAPCQLAVDTLGYEGECNRRNELVVVFEYGGTITFS